MRCTIRHNLDQNHPSHNSNNLVDDKSMLEKIIKNFFTGMLEKNILALAYDLDGKIVASTKCYAKLLGFKDYKQIIGKTQEEINILGKNNGKEMIIQLNKIRLEAQTKGEIISYTAYLKIQDKFYFLTSTIMPLCALNAKIVGTAVSIKTSKILSLRDIIYPKLPFQPELNDLLEEHRRNNLNRPLTRRQEEVLFLLIGGLTQEQIADTLGITRGSVSNYLLSISYKFGLSTQATSKIINIGIQNGYDKCIPHNLLRPKIIMLTHEYLLETPNTNNYAIN